MAVDTLRSGGMEMKFFKQRTTFVAFHSDYPTCYTPRYIQDCVAGVRVVHYHWMFSFGDIGAVDTCGLVAFDLGGEIFVGFRHVVGDAVSGS